MFDDEEPRRPYPHPYQSPDETPTAGMPRLPANNARTVHRLRQIQQVSDLAINVIDQALERAS